MAVELFDGVGNTAVTIDPTSKAMRTSRYGPDGVPSDLVRVGGYIARFDIVPTTLTSLTPYFSFGPTGTRTLAVREWEFITGFTGAVPAASQSSIILLHYVSGMSFSGGNLTQQIKLDNNMPYSTTDIRFAPGGLTIVGGLSAENLFSGLITTQYVDTEQDFEYVSENDPAKLLIGPGEGLVFLSVGTVVSGVYISGSITWDEYARPSEVAAVIL